jgi:DNA polymerase-3 subunit alpha
VPQLQAAPRAPEPPAPEKPMPVIFTSSEPGTLPPLPPVAHILPPLSRSFGEKEENQPRMMTIILRATGEKERDIRRLRRLYNEMHSCPGNDRFAFLIFEGGHNYLIEFPSDTTGLCSDLMQRLNDLVGSENLRIEPIKIQ